MYEPTVQLLVAIATGEPADQAVVRFLHDFGELSRPFAELLVALDMPGDERDDAVSTFLLANTSLSEGFVGVLLDIASGEEANAAVDRFLGQWVTDFGMPKEESMPSASVDEQMFVA